MKKYLLSLAVLSLFAGADAAAMGEGFEPLPTGSGDGGTPCVMNENANINVTLNGSADDIDIVSAQLKAKTEEIKALAREAHFVRFVVQSTNYNIRSADYNRHNPLANYVGDNPQQGQYRYTGNISLSLQPADKALKFMKVLTDKGYRANINVNSYNSGNCQQ